MWRQSLTRIRIRIGLAPWIRTLIKTDADPKNWIVLIFLVDFRIGRTGRRNNSGTAYTFFTEKNGKNAGPLIQILTEAKQVPIVD